MSKENETSDKAQNGNDFIADVSGSAIPLLDEIQIFPIYSYVERWLYFRIERNYRDGRMELVAKIPKSLTGGKKIAEAMTRTLSDKRNDFMSDEICPKHQWIKTKKGRVCENCGEWSEHYR